MKSTRLTFPGVRDWYHQGWLMPWMVLVAALMVTYMVWRGEQQNVMKDLQIDFDFRVRETQSRIYDRMTAYEQILRGARALFMASGNVTQQEFRSYFDSLHLEENYPGSQGIGFAPVVSPARKDTHIAAMRAAGFSGYAVKPAGGGDIYAPVSYIEPLTGNNRQSIGYDLFSDPVRRAALERARDTGKAVNSGKLLLPQDVNEDIRIQSGFVMFLPVYRNGAPLATVAERRANIIGWVYAPFRMVDLMTGILGEIATEIDIEIHDGEDITNKTMMYDPDVSGAGGNPHAIFRNTGRVEIGARPWTVVIVSLPGFEAQADSKKPNWVAFIGVQMSLLLTILAWLLVQGRARAVQAAEDINRELTERKRAEEGLRLAATVVKTVEEAVMVTDRDNLIVAVNPAFTAITGYADGDVIGKTPRILASGRHTKEFYKELWDTLLATGSWHGEIWDRRKGGDIYIKWLSIKLVRDEEGKITHHVAVFADITDRKAAEERMKHLAHHDVLTDLPNRTLFADRLQQGLTQAKRDKSHLALMFIDLDRFKPVNDTYGHAVGDLLLKEVAKRLQNCVRKADTVSRIGGDEFVVLLPSIEAGQDAMLVARKMLQVIDEPFELAGHNLHISGSIGIAVYPDHGRDERTLTQCADIAMYYAKSGGRNNVRLYQPDMRDISQ